MAITEQLLLVIGGSVLVQEFDANDPPAGLTDAEMGQWWKIGPTPTGEWVGHEDQLAKWTGHEWAFIDVTAPGVSGLVSAQQITGAGAHSRERWSYSPVESMWHPRDPIWSTTEHWTGRYAPNGSKWYAKGIDFGALPNATTKNVAHGVSGIVIDTDGTNYLSAPILLGAATNGTNVYDIAQGSQGLTGLWAVTATNVSCVSTMDLTALKAGIRLEYTR